MGLKQKLVELNGQKVPVTEGKVMGDATRVAVVEVDDGYRSRRKWGVRDQFNGVLIDGMSKVFPTQEGDWVEWEETVPGAFGSKPKIVVYPCIHVRAWDTNPISVRRDGKAIEHPVNLALYKRGLFTLELSNASLQAQGKTGDFLAGLKNVPRWAWFLIAAILAAAFLWYSNPAMFKDLLHLQQGR